MEEIQSALGSAVGRISDQNYEESLAYYRFWFDIGQAYHEIPSDLILNTTLDSRTTNSKAPTSGELIHLAAHLTPRFASDAESDQILAPHSPRLQNRLCARILQDFFRSNLAFVRNRNTGRWDGSARHFCADTNLIAHWANLGYVEEAAIRNHILQSLISRSTLYDHQANALIILFKLAGATFEAYADPSVVDRCFELLKDHYSRVPTWQEPSDVRAERVAKGKLAQVCAFT
jgi:hypothetical protein